MEWLEICIDTKTEELELLCAHLISLGISGLVVEDEDDFQKFLEANKQYWDYIDEDLASAMKGKCRVKFYLEKGYSADKTLDSLGGTHPFSVSTVKEEDWENNWRQYYRPIDVGERLVIIPAWEDVPTDKGRIPLRLDPGLIFGTGSHPTTRMCLLRLMEAELSGASVLDLGCGSGILGIAALLLGAERVLGCDIDEKAQNIASKNAELNGIGDDCFSVFTGNVLTDEVPELKKRKFRMITANIVADVIIALCPRIPDWLADGGTFLCSGILEGRQEEVLSALKAAGLQVAESLKLEDWHCFEAKNFSKIQIPT